MTRFFIIVMVALLVACKGSVPVSYEQVSSKPEMFPDYTDITIPYNIAPLNFYIEKAQKVSVKIIGRNEYLFTSHSSLVKFPIRRWKQLLEAEKGSILEIYVTARFDRKDFGYQSFKWTIATEPIDKYLSYRLIEPAYEIWNMLQICERNVENFDVRILGDNNITDHSCLNCHTSNHADIQTTFMHVRGPKGGTIYNRSGKIRKINTKTPQTAGPAVYGEIEAKGRYGIFATAKIMPILHSYRTERLEVFDTQSDLILIDFEKRTVSDKPCVTGNEFQETFPCFSADGKTIYFCRAPHLLQPDSTRQMHYNLYSIAFDPETGELGNEVKLVIDAASMGKSISFPKCSRDGKYLLFTVSDYGTFPIWHTETDLWLLNLTTAGIDKMEHTNGRYSDSYHSWSSNSKWISFASKRDDRVYGRPYFAYIGDDGAVSKAFVLPQKDPKCYLVTLKSYNIPELYNIPESYDAKQIERLYFKGETEQLQYKK